AMLKRQKSECIPATVVFHAYTEFSGTAAKDAPSSVGVAVFILFEHENELKICKFSKG
ncbi:hypothetical protein A2U01_0049067, partial [Trifolium medium]|nr:hypothetical protein [Trifolium medium]